MTSSNCDAFCMKCNNLLPCDTTLTNFDLLRITKLRTVFFTARIRSRGKVMFPRVFICSQRRVCIFTMSWEGKPRPPRANPLRKQPHPPIRRQTACQNTSTTTGYGQQAGGTHPTGMYICFGFSCTVTKLDQ